MSIRSAISSKLVIRGNLGQRAIKAGFWSVLEVGIQQVLRLASNLIMTRILLPEAFGIMAIVLMLLTALSLFSDIGIHRSIVRSPRGDQPHYLQAAWSVQILRSIAIALAVLMAGIGLWLLGPRLASPGTVYADRQLPFLIMVASLSLIFQGLTSTNRWLAARNVAYGRLTMIRLAAQVLSLALMVPLALATHSVWALLLALLINPFVIMLLSHIALPGPRMAWIWDPEIASELWNFGKWLIGSSTFTFIQNSADRLILAALLPAQSFGFYIISVLWVNVGVLLVQRLIEQVGFSTISEVVNKRPHDLERHLRKLRTVLDAICVAGFLGLLFVGPLIVKLLYPPQYETSAHYLPYLAPLILTMRYQILGSIALAQGNTRLVMIVSALNAGFMILFLFTGFELAGMRGALLAVAYAQLPSSVLLMRWAAKNLKLSVAHDISWFAGILAVGGLVILTAPI